MFCELLKIRKNYFLFSWLGLTRSTPTGGKKISESVFTDPSNEALGELPCMVEFTGLLEMNSVAERGSACISYWPILVPSEKVILIKSCSARNIHKWQVSETGKLQHSIFLET